MTTVVIKVIITLVTVTSMVTMTVIVNVIVIVTLIVKMNRMHGKVCSSDRDKLGTS